MAKIFFPDNVEWHGKNLSKMISADVKANVKQQEINYLVALSYKFLQEVSSKLEIQCKRAYVFI